MDERLAALIEQIVRDAHLNSGRARDDLRRELESHFAEFEQRPQALREAIERFGNPADVSARIRDAHHRARSVRTFLRIGTALAASAGAALLLQIGANLRVNSRTQTIAFAPGFAVSAAFSAFIIVVLIGAWELDIDSLCSRLERRPFRLMLLLAGLVASMVLTHAVRGSVVPLSTAFAASAVDVAIWACTLAILSHIDRAFAAVFSRRRR